MPGRIKKQVEKFHSWYARFERPISSISLIGGFVWNALFLTRADLFKENLWIVVHIILAAVGIVLINRQEKGEGDTAEPAKTHFWLATALQFLFGGLLSTFIVFYFRSAVLSVTWPFFVVLFAAFVANEALKRSYLRLAFQIAFLALSILLFAVYGIPLLAHRTGADIFIFSSIISLGVVLIFLAILRASVKNILRKQNKTILIGAITGVFVVMNGLYFFHLIPPLPLSLADTGVYHSIIKLPDGSYSVTEEDAETTFWTRLESTVQRPKIIHAAPGERIYAYTAIFSPVAFTINTMHTWEWYDPEAKEWVVKIASELPIVGGREGGFRTYSSIQDPREGKWRVSVETGSGEVIGRIPLTIVRTDTPVRLIRDVKE